MSTPFTDPALWAVFYESPWRLDSFWAEWLRTDVARLHQLIHAGRLQAVTFEGQLYLPRYTFLNNQPHPGMATLLAQGGRPGWSLAQWFITPHPELGESPLAVWDSHPHLVIEAWTAERQRSAA